VQVYTMAADARLRDGQPASAVDILKPVYERAPNDALARRLGLAYVMAGRFAEAVPVLDASLAADATDQDLLFAAVVAHYEVARAGQTPSNEDRAKLRRYAAAYRGDNAALIDKYLAVIEGR
jgi:hypothetical protein